jgi:DNA-binding NarL/FixJ family response regulator
MPTALTGTSVNVLLADDHPIVQQGLRALLEEEEDIRVVGTASDGEQALALVESLDPDVVVMDIEMPKLNGLDVTARINRNFKRTKVIILSMFDDRAHVRKAIDVGVKGYLVKQTFANDIIMAIREVAIGHAFFSPAIAGILLERKTTAGPHAKNPGLSPRELEILKLVTTGSSTPEISRQLCISVKTVDKHRQQIMDKLGIHDVVGLTHYAIANKLHNDVEGKG